MDKTFTCSLCKMNYITQHDEEWNDAKNLEEMLTLHPECKDHSYDSVCDNCFQMIEKWLSTLTDEEKRRINAKNELWNMYTYWESENQKVTKNLIDKYKAVLDKLSKK